MPAAAIEPHDRRVGTVRTGVAVLGSLVGLALCAACGGDAPPDPEWVQELRAERSHVTIGEDEAPATTLGRASDDASAPVLEATGEDFERIWREVQAFETWLLAHPRERGRLPEIYVEGTEIHQRTVELLADLVAQDARMVVHGYEILEVSVLQRPDPDTALVRYTDTRDRREFLDVRTGEVIDSEEFEDQPWTWDLTLQRGSDGRWRIADISFVGRASEDG